VSFIGAFRFLEPGNYSFPPLRHLFPDSLDAIAVEFFLQHRKGPVFLLRAKKTHANRASDKINELQTSPMSPLVPAIS